MKRCPKCPDNHADVEISCVPYGSPPVPASRTYEPRSGWKPWVGHPGVVTIMIMAALVGVITSCTANVKEDIHRQSSTTPTATTPIGNPAERSLAGELVGHRWRARSDSLAHESLEVTFKSDNSFEGKIKTSPNDYAVKPGPVNGRWHVVGSRLFLKYILPMTVGGYTYPGEVEQAIDITQGSADKLVGVDKHGRLWEWERID